MKLLLSCLSLLLPLLATSQIKVDDVGDGWKYKVEQALSVVQQYDNAKYDFILCESNHISYTLAKFATTEGDSTILIAQREIIAGCINDLAAALVHESMHLYFLHNGIKMSHNEEEFTCYAYELDFLLSIPNVEPWLIDHAKKYMEYYSK